MVELVERRAEPDTERRSVSTAAAAGGVVLALAATVGPSLIGGGAMRCSLPLAAVAGLIAPPDDADARWYTSRALLFVGVAAFFVVGIADPLRGDTDFLAAVAAILVGAALAQTGDE